MGDDHHTTQHPNPEKLSMTYLPSRRTTKIATPIPTASDVIGKTWTLTGDCLSSAMKRYLEIY
ncbi:hypothetical protein CCYS_10980 [Corynebacterium cystitidis DSM 20524]|uniref:Uncharacterized protein n=1 Tax=Corynebacterium cystitidis DSM 20524 TaxID=1121357 RepID=A0A1H9SLK3_9CORY|nr:hypothetical protein CCYS_10980 [Corynebacterium cystitidis DSM 20524]SER85882.1 hypothetical protein SAMN05661109_01173 [Corynebacterium cystitidis DSM 20524]SNV66164.1 Uncharacterised protein [Corynebacterium cystitidis]